MHRRSPLPLALASFAITASLLAPNASRAQPGQSVAGAIAATTSPVTTTR